MNRFIIITICAFIATLSPAKVHAYQFETYEWGKSFDEITEQLKKNNKKFFKDFSGPVILYDDSILNRDCRVYLYFTPKTKALGMLIISWKSELVGKEVLDLLIKKYGIPEKSGQSADTYVWGGRDDSDGILLNYNHFKTTLSYRSGAHGSLIKSEQSEINERELSRF
jgi:hypothetical protein